MPADQRWRMHGHRTMYTNCFTLRYKLRYGLWFLFCYLETTSVVCFFKYPYFIIFQCFHKNLHFYRTSLWKALRKFCRSHSRRLLCLWINLSPNGFYRATRMHSADYAMAKCSSVRPSVRLYVCLSHAGIVSKRLYISSKFFLPAGSPPL